MSGPSVLDVDGHRVRITTPERVLYPRAGFTKGRMLEYYAAIAPAILPHLAGRPVSLRRFPEGVEGYTWYQTRCGPTRPSWMRTCTLEVPGGEPQDYCVIDDVAGLLWAVNLSTIELHPLLMRVDAPDTPTSVVLDLDPGAGAGLLECCHVALLLKDALERIGLVCLVKTSGSRGMHVVVPLNTTCTFDETKAFARDVARSLAAAEQSLVVDRQDRNARAGRVLLDWLQNDWRRSTVVAYSLRAGDVPIVSMPLRWSDVERALSAGSDEDLWFGVRTALQTVRSLGDPFEDAQTLRQSLPTGTA